MAYELKPCPFCEGPAEIFAERSFQHRYSALCETEEEALSKLEYFKTRGTVIDYFIGPRPMKRANMSHARTKWAVWAEFKAFIPRCCAPTCLGRLSKAFLTEKEAREVWNRRGGETGNA